MREPEYIRKRRGDREMFWYLRDQSFGRLFMNIFHMLMSDRMTLRKKNDGVEMSDFAEQTKPLDVV